MKSTVSVSKERRRLTPLACALAMCAIGFLAGCESEPESHIVSAPPPPPPAMTATTVYSTPAYTTTQPTITAVPSPTGGSSIVVMQAPPAAQQEVPPLRPSPDYVWVAGYWSWKTDHYLWTAGQWVIPPHQGAVWVPPRWEPENGAWRFYEGYWD